MVAFLLCRQRRRTQRRHRSIRGRKLRLAVRSATDDSEQADVHATAFFTGYLIEKSLAEDNIFIFLMIFNYFSVPLRIRNGC